MFSNRIPEFPYLYLQYLNQATKAVTLAATWLGGTGGAGGGSGGPPGGFLGQLIQSRVAYDTTEGAVFTTGSASSLVDNLNHIRARLGSLESVTSGSAGAIVGSAEYVQSEYVGADLNLGLSSDGGWVDVDATNAAISITPSGAGVYQATFSFTHYISWLTTPVAENSQTSFRLTDGTTALGSVNVALHPAFPGEPAWQDAVNLSGLFAWGSTAPRTVKLQKWNTTSGSSSVHLIVVSGGSALHMDVFRLWSTAYNPVLGTGAVGQVAFWTSGSALSSNSNFLWDTPTTKLTIPHLSVTSGSILMNGSRFQVDAPFEVDTTGVTSGSFLGYNGNKWVPMMVSQGSGGGGVSGLSGSGANPQVAYFTSGSVLSSSANMNWDNTAARLFVGSAQTNITSGSNAGIIDRKSGSNGFTSIVSSNNSGDVPTFLGARSDGSIGSETATGALHPMVRLDAAGYFTSTGVGWTGPVARIEAINQSPGISGADWHSVWKIWVTPSGSTTMREVLDILSNGVQSNLALPGSTAIWQVQNTDNSNPGSDAVMVVYTGGSNGGDPSIQLGADVQWNIGSDTSNGGAFKIDFGYGSLGSNTALKIDSAFLPTWSLSRQVWGGNTIKFDAPIEIDTTGGSTGQVLALSGGKWVPTTVSGVSGNISGSGVAGQLTYWTSGSALGGQTSALYDSTNHRMIIGGAPLADVPFSYFSGGFITARVANNDSGFNAASWSSTANVAPFHNTIRARGTSGSPGKVLNGDLLGRFAARGYYDDGAGTKGYSNEVGQLLFYAGENYSDPFTWGSYASIMVTPIGSTTLVESMRFYDDHLLITGKSFKLDHDIEIDTTGGSTGQFLSLSGGKWIPTTISGSGASGISGSGSNGQVAYFTSGSVLSSNSGLAWDNVAQKLTASHLSVTSGSMFLSTSRLTLDASMELDPTGATNGQVMGYNGIKWIPTTSSGSPGGSSNPSPISANATSGSGATFGSASNTIIDFSNVVWDTASGITTGGSWHYTVPVAGKYRVTASLVVNGDFASGNYMRLDVNINGALTSILYYSEANSGTGINVPLLGTDTFNLAIGDTIAINFDNHQSGTLTLALGSPYQYINIERLSVVITETGDHTTNARASTSSGQSLTAGSDTVVNFDAVNWDTTSSITPGAGWVYTIPATGKYLVSAALLANGTYVSGSEVSMNLLLNGSAYASLYYTESYSGSFFAPMVGSTIVSATVGDTIAISVHNSNAGALSLAANTLFQFIDIEKQ